jgi:hypothetical protein
MNEQKNKREIRTATEETVTSNVTLTQVDSVPPTPPGDTMETYTKREAILRSTEPTQIVQEKTTLVLPRRTVTRFRCAGQWWCAISGREMRVPNGVALHMKEVGML